MANQAAQLRKIIEMMVKKEVNAVLEQALPEILPQMIKECFAGLIMESNVSRPSLTGNSGKRVALQEVSGDADDYEEYPTMRTTKNPQLDRAHLAEMMGYGDMSPRGGAIRSISGEQPGMNVAVPDNLVDVFNKDYRQLMQTINAKKKGG